MKNAPLDPDAAFDYTKWLLGSKMDPKSHFSHPVPVGKMPRWWWLIAVHAQQED